MARPIAEMSCVGTPWAIAGKAPRLSRHALAALLLDQDYFEEAIDVYEADLGLNDEVIRANRHPNNVWALLGLYRCYIATARVNEARLIKPQLDIALARADKGLYASCFCARS